MSTQSITGRQQPTSEFIMIDPTTGLALGTAAAPLQTGTSALQTTADLTVVGVAITTATTTIIVNAVASQRTRVYRLRIDVAAAQTLTFNAVTNDVFTFAGAGHYVLDFATRPWFITGFNTAFTVTSTTTAATTVIAEFTRTTL